MVASARGFVFVAVLFVSSLLYATTLLFPATLLLVPVIPHSVYITSRRAYRRWSGWVGYLFFANAVYLLEHFCKIKHIGDAARCWEEKQSVPRWPQPDSIVWFLNLRKAHPLLVVMVQNEEMRSVVKVTGDLVPFGEAALIICNHRTRVDWMFLWCLCLRQGQLSGLKIVLKESLKGIPGFGWATQMLLFVFLARKRTKDVRRVREISEYLVGLNMPTTLLIFPEGTDLSPSNHQKSLNFARKEGLAEYQYVLHPKVRGFAECVQALRPTLDAVHDVTIGYHNYKDGGPPSEKTILAGCFPAEVHMHVRRHTINDLAAGDERLQEWCREAFKEKEALLKAFYEGSRSFDSGSRKGGIRDEDDVASRRSGLMALVFFIASLLLVLIYGGTIFAWFALTAGCVCTLATAFGGWDTLELWWCGFSLGNVAGFKQD